VLGVVVAAGKDWVECLDFVPEPEPVLAIVPAAFAVAAVADVVAEAALELVLVVTRIHLLMRLVLPLNRFERLALLLLLLLLMLLLLLLLLLHMLLLLLLLGCHLSRTLLVK
jgi:hypothetical protein